MTKTEKIRDERRLYAQRLAQKKYRQKNRERLNAKAKERAATARAKIHELPPEVQEAKHQAKLASARRYRERNNVEINIKARMRRLNKFFEVNPGTSLKKYRTRARTSLG
ncbi:hypothetical protein H0H92_006943 [Tricholoma furcatifolium]|nr:hypothetical protein H0H92_006943 [Tricholoma furcatifolium]